MSQLNTKQIYPNTPVVTVSPTTFVKPLSYDFRVAEYLDENKKITKVALQIQVWEHNEDGFGNCVQPWRDVERVQFDSKGAMIFPF